ncbi:unnamed protein product [Parascedosporium putredinis]|uniref:Uncharacterized protein n=1 Tax=Parascedosporium putredinis TaxID=1442378 RepID=A0A9P1MC87_9PEZI|nr:unnamed protein product [Parascedosporium putredinis]CAI7997944.1 unnamed protein product [Parascedosporium putredinis]
MDPSHLFLSMADADFSRYDHHMDPDGIYADECNSPCAESCRSQCGEDGEADICYDPNCDEISDLCTNDSCVDQIKCCPVSCPVPALSENDEDAAVTLASIGSGDQPAGSLLDGDLSLHSQDSLHLASSTSPQTSLMSSPISRLTLIDDLILHHNPSQPPHATPHFRPCPLDNATFITRRCMLPRSVYDGADAQCVIQATEATNPHMLANPCGVFLSGPDDVIPHIASTHPHAFNTLQSYLEAGATYSRLNESNRLAFYSPWMPWVSQSLATAGAYSTRAIARLLPRRLMIPLPHKLSKVTQPLTPSTSGLSSAANGKRTQASSATKVSTTRRAYTNMC